MRVCIEATGLIGPRTGVGHSTAALVENLVEVDDGIEISLLPVSVQGAGKLRHSVPDHPRIRPLRARIPARLAHAVWTRASWPPAEMFCGSVDVVHGPNFLLPPALKAAGVLTVHDLAFHRMPEACSVAVRTYNRTVPLFCERAHRIIVVSKTVERELGEWLPGVADRIRVVHNGVRRVFLEEGGSLAEPRRQQLGIRDPYVIHVGTLELRKNIDLLLEAFAIVRGKVPDAQLVLIGTPGVGWEEVAARHADLLATDAVRRPGYLPDSEVAALVRGARASVYPSRYEGFGIPPLEAMACRTPVIASDIPVLRESLDGHATFVEVADATGLADAITAHLDGAPEQDPLDAARAWAESFTWERNAAATLRVYREAIAEVME